MMITFPALIVAYIDPSSGGLLFQVLVVIFVFLSGLVLFFSSRLKMAVARLRRFLRDRFRKDQSDI